ncbi:hypothetical protein PYCC9005_002799 [Savitreella phatthalungensis]
MPVSPAQQPSAAVAQQPLQADRSQVQHHSKKQHQMHVDTSMKNDTDEFDADLTLDFFPPEEDPLSVLEMLGSKSPSRVKFGQHHFGPPQRQADIATHVQFLYAGIPELTPLEQRALGRFAEARKIIPSVTFLIEGGIWDKDLHRLCAVSSCILYTVLSFTSSFAILQSGQSLHHESNSQLLSATMIYRGRALQSLQQIIHTDNVDMLDAALGSTLLLADQAAFEGDWKTFILHLRGFNNLLARNAGIAISCRFAALRGGFIDPMVLRTRIDRTAIERVSHGRSCLSALFEIQRFLNDTYGAAMVDSVYGDGFAMKDLDETTTKDTGLSGSASLVRYRLGGLQHLVYLACEVYSLHQTVVDAAGGGEELTPERKDAIMQQAVKLKLESQRWSGMGSTQAHSLLFAEDAVMVALLAIKLALDLFLHRCILFGMHGTTDPRAAARSIERRRSSGDVSVSDGQEPGDSLVNACPPVALALDFVPYAYNHLLGLARQSEVDRRTVQQQVIRQELRNTNRGGDTTRRSSKASAQAAQQQASMAALGESMRRPSEAHIKRWFSFPIWTLGWGRQFRPGAVARAARQQREAMLSSPLSANSAIHTTIHSTSTAHGGQPTMALAQQQQNRPGATPRHLSQQLPTPGISSGGQAQYLSPSHPPPQNASPDDFDASMKRGDLYISDAAFDKWYTRQPSYRQRHEPSSSTRRHQPIPGTEPKSSP